MDAKQNCQEIEERVTLPKENSPNQVEELAITISKLTKKSNTEERNKTSSGSRTPSSVPDHEKHPTRPPSSPQHQQKKPSLSPLYAVINKRVMFQLLMFLCTFGCLVAALSSAKLRELMIWHVAFWKWCVFVMVTLSGLGVATFFFDFLPTSLIEKNLINIYLLFFVHRLRKSLALFVWMVSVTLVWICLIDHGVKRSKLVSRVFNFVTWTIVSLAFGSFLMVLKSLLLKLLATRFQMNAYFDRIQQNLFGQYALDVLSQLPNKKRDQTRHKELLKLLYLPEDNVSAWTVKKLVKFIRDLRLITNLKDDKNEDDLEIKDEHQAVTAARKLFKNIAKDDSREIEKSDLTRFLDEEEANMFGWQIQGYLETGKIKEEALKDWLLFLLRERKVFELALQKINAVLKRLGKIISGIIAVVVFIIWVLAMKIMSAEAMAVFLTAVAFTLGNTCKNIFEAAIFVFVAHPFDIGDYCNIEGNKLFVDQIGILKSVFLTGDNERIYYPNSVLATKQIINYNHSRSLCETMLFTVNLSIEKDTIKKLRAKVMEYLERTPEEWYPRVILDVNDVKIENKFQISISCTYKTYFHDYSKRQRRRIGLILAMEQIFKELNMEYIPVLQRPQLAGISKGIVSETFKNTLVLRTIKVRQLINKVKRKIRNR